MVFYRTEDGNPAALFDRCPHRGMPLSLGTVLKDTLQCKYHGIEFTSEGACARIPSGGAISPKMCVQSFPVAEVWDWLWVWPGDPSLADPSLIPDLETMGFGAPGFYSNVGPMLSVNANYLLTFENFLDASHISFLHDGKIDTGEEIGRASCRERVERWVGDGLVRIGSV